MIENAIKKDKKFEYISFLQFFFCFCSKKMKLFYS